eukprot:9554888-Lingulodinium_polyedra.AAC.1
MLRRCPGQSVKCIQGRLTTDKKMPAHSGGSCLPQNGSSTEPAWGHYEHIAKLSLRVVHCHPRVEEGL